MTVSECGYFVVSRAISALDIAACLTTLEAAGVTDYSPDGLAAFVEQATARIVGLTYTPPEQA